MSVLFWSAIDTAATAFNHIAVSLHEVVDVAVGGDALLSYLLTTFIVSGVMALILTALFMAAWLTFLRPIALQLLSRLRGSLAHTNAAAAAPKSATVSSKRSCGDISCSACSCVGRGPAEIVLKLRLHGEHMWQRLVLNRRRVRTMAALHDEIRTKLASFAAADAAGALQGFTAADLRLAKVSRLTLLPDVLLTVDSDVATLKPGDELEVQLKL